MDRSRREVLEGIQYQGAAESIVRSIDTLPWGGSPTSPSLVVLLEPELTDVTADVTSASPTALGDDLILPALHSLEAGLTYRLLVRFTIAGNNFEAILRVAAED